MEAHDRCYLAPFFLTSGSDDRKFINECVLVGYKILTMLYYYLGEQGRNSPDLEDNDMLSGQPIQR